MKTKIFVTLMIFIFLSCGDDKSENLYKTKGGEFASKTGNFIVNFPNKPRYKTIDNQIGLDKFQIHLY